MIISCTADTLLGFYSVRTMIVLTYRLLCTVVTDLVEECNATSLSASEIGGATCGDAAVVRHMGSHWSGLPQYIAHKPLSLGIKLYVLCDNTFGYVMGVYLYIWRRGRIRQTGICVGNIDAKSIMRFRALLLPPQTVPVAD